MGRDWQLSQAEALRFAKLEEPGWPADCVGDGVLAVHNNRLNGHGRESIGRIFQRIGRNELVFRRGRGPGEAHAIRGERFDAELLRTIEAGDVEGVVGTAATGTNLVVQS